MFITIFKLYTRDGERGTQKTLEIANCRIAFLKGKLTAHQYDVAVNYLKNSLLSNTDEL